MGLGLVDWVLLREREREREREEWFVNLRLRVLKMECKISA